jgi:hypothetical protein
MLEIKCCISTIYEKENVVQGLEMQEDFKSTCLQVCVEDKSQHEGA